MANMLTNEAHDATEETQIVQPDPVESLAENTSTIVSRLYSLHAVLEAQGDVYAHHIHLLSMTKTELGKQWEGWLEFFRECLGHLRTCRRLYEVLQTSEVSQVQAIFNPTLSIAASITKTASGLPISYQTTLALLLSKAKEATQYRPRDSIREPNDLPTVTRELSAFLDALQSSVKCLEGIASYWDEHHTTLRGISESTLNVKALIVVEGTTVAMWTRYHDLVHRAVSDITSSCDALTVDPPQRKKSRKSLRSRLFLMAAPPMPSPTLPLLLPPSTPPPPQERFRQEDSLFLSNDQFDVPSVARASSQVASRLQKLHLKDEQIPAKFLPAFELLIEIAEAGKVFYLNAGNLLQIPRSQDEMRGAVTRIRTTLDKDLALWHELNSFNLYDDSNLDDRGTELNGQEHDPYVQEALGRLVDKLTEFRKFWEEMALELEEDNIQNLLRIDELKLPREVWNLQVSHYRECIKEIKESQTPFLSTDTLDGVRSRTIQHRRRIKQSMTSLLTLFQMRLACSVGFRGSQKMTREELVDFDDEEKDI
ncbi:hypothetical protein AB1N83_012282 [Pleurotus pulmonarius]